MSHDLFWLQIACGVVVYTATKIDDPAMNSFHRAFITVTSGVYGGYGFWKTSQILNGKSNLSLFTTWDYVTYLGSMLMATCVIWSFTLIIYRLIRPRAK